MPGLVQPDRLQRLRRVDVASGFARLRRLKTLDDSVTATRKTQADVCRALAAQSYECPVVFGG